MPHTISGLPRVSIQLACLLALCLGSSPACAQIAPAPAGAPAAAVPPTVTLLFDEVVTGVGKVDHDLAEEFLDEAAGRGLVFMVLRAEGRLHLMQGPTTDIDAVRKAVAASTMAKRPQMLAATDAAEQQMENDAKNASGSRRIMAKVLKAMLLDSQHTVKTDAQTTNSVAALLAASRGQQILEGRKFIIFFSQGLPFPRSTPEVFGYIARAANKAGVNIYAVDAEIGDPDAASGLMASAALGTEGAMGNLSAGTTDAAGTATVADEFTGRMIAGNGGRVAPSLEGICIGTGGKHLYALDRNAVSHVRGIAMEIAEHYRAAPAVERGLALGDVLLVERIDPAAAAEAAGPLRYGAGKVIPNLSGHVSKAASPKVGFFVDVHPDPASTEAPALSVEVRRDGELAATVPLKLSADPQRYSIPYMFALGAASLSPGPYKVTVILNQGGKSVSNSVSFTLE